VRQHRLYRFARKENRKLLTTHAISSAAAGYLREFRSHQSQNLIPGFVAVGIVEFLEVIDIHNRHRVRLFQVE